MSLCFSLRPENYPFWNSVKRPSQQPKWQQNKQSEWVEFSGKGADLRSNLWSVVVEDDGAEVTAVVVGNEVFSGVGALQTACSHALVLQQSLVQCEKHLQRKRQMFLLLFYLKRTSLLHFLRSTLLRLSKKCLPFQNKCNVTLIYNGTLIARCKWNLSLWWLHFCFHISTGSIRQCEMVRSSTDCGTKWQKKNIYNLSFTSHRARAP